MSMPVAAQKTPLLGLLTSTIDEYPLSWAYFSMIGPIFASSSWTILFCSPSGAAPARTMPARQPRSGTYLGRMTYFLFIVNDAISCAQPKLRTQSSPDRDSELRVLLEKRHRLPIGGD